MSIWGDISITFVQIMLSLSGFLQQFLRKILDAFQAYNDPKKEQNSKQIESAVAIILKLPDGQDQFRVKQNCQFELINAKIEYFLDTKLLLLQRGNRMTQYSGDVCLPGGKRQAYQSLEETVFRQVSQQTGLKLDRKQLVGMVKRKFNAHNVLVTHAFVFLVKCQQELQINTQELSSYKWIRLRHFLSNDIYKYQELPTIFTEKGLGVKPSQNVQVFLSFAAVDVGFKKGLFGLTLHILSQLLRQINLHLLKLYKFIGKQEERISNQNLQILSEVKQKVENCLLSCLRVKNRYYVQWKVKFSSPVPEKQRQKIEKEVIKIMDSYYRERPRL